jgi:MFS family permease
VPLFLRELKASNLTIGLIPAMISFGYLLPGLLVAKRIAALPVGKWWLFFVAVGERIPLLLIALLIPVIGAGRPSAVLWLFIAGFAVHALLLGTNQPAYWTVVGKVIPVRQRGRMFGWAGALGGAAGVMIDPITRHFLTPDGVATLRGFSSCFLIGTIVLWAGIIPFTLFDEPRTVAPAEVGDSHVGRFWSDARQLLKGSPSLRRLILGQCAVSIASMAQPFFVLDYAERFHVAGSTIADFTTIGVVLGAFGSLLWGLWADRRGNKGVLVVSSLLAAIAAGLAYFSPPAIAYYAVFAASALSASGIGLASYNIVMEFADKPSNIPFHTALFNASIAPFRTLAPVVGGLLADRHGYGCVFAVSAVTAMVGLWLTARMVEPRGAPTGGV